MFEIVAPAFLIGLLGAGHCFGMCGGIASALTFALGDVPARRKTGILFFYSLGRVLSYSAVGAGVSLAFSFLPDTSMAALRWLAAGLLILMGLYVSGIWKILSRLETLGKWVWSRIQPLAARLMPVTSYPQALLFGAIWGWLPCGLVYTATVYAAAQANVAYGAVSMLAFGAGTLPAILSLGVFAGLLKGFLQSKGFRGVSGLVLVLFGLWTLWSGGHSHHAMDHSKQNDHSHHHHHH